MSWFTGIGQWAATFSCEGVENGQVVKVSGNGAVASCGAGEGIGGVVVSLGRDKKACGVALGGIVCVPYTGDAPAVGWSGRSADGAGGVACDADGRAYLVVDVDDVGKMVTFAL